MPYDLFISYSRRDNQSGRITEFVERIGRDFESFAGRPLRPFFDIHEIHGMDDWRHRILTGLRESRLLLSFLSPSLLASEYCAWEFNEYVNNEVARALVGEGVAPIYFVEVPDWGDKDYEAHCAEWIAELRRRQHYDLRPWFNEGVQALREAVIQDRLEDLNRQIAERIKRGEIAEKRLGNVVAHNPHFIGRRTEIRKLRETFALKKIGMLTAIHGLGGMGKTAAEPLMRRVIEILLNFTAATGHQHPHQQAAINNYAMLLDEMGYDETKIIETLNEMGIEIG